MTRYDPVFVRNEKHDIIYGGFVSLLAVNDCFLFFISWHLFAPKTGVFGRDDVTVAPQIHKTNEDVGRCCLKQCNRSPRRRLQSSEQRERSLGAAVASAGLKCQKKPLATAAVGELYEVRAKAEAEDAQLRTGSDTE